MPQVSVIIPVFNAALHLKKCIDSLLGQTLDSCEFIFVNDGSTDDSQSILENYLAIDSRIKLLNQNNQGVSVARNNGIEHAIGTYIGFVDADDYVAPDYFETLHKNAVANNLDVVGCRYYFSIDGRRFESAVLFEQNIVLGKDYVEKNSIATLIGNDSLNAIWNKLYRKSLLDTHAIKFPKGVALGEDGWFNLCSFSVAERVLFLDYVGYFYEEVQGSATRDLQSKNYFQRIVEDYNLDYSIFENRFIDASAIDFLKASKFIKKSIALLHVYHDPSNKINALQRKSLTKEILYHQILTKILDSYYNMLFLQKSKYEKTILFALKYKLVYMVTGIIAYSYFRNKKK